MKICLFLIIGFIHYAFCCYQNFTDEGYHACPNKFRRKRTVTEYTRWRGNLESSPEFIVKILDDDIPPPKPKKIVAVNIQQAKKNMEKIIIGGAMVTLPISKPSTISAQDMIDYTRFVQPTTVSNEPAGGIYLPPLQPAARKQSIHGKLQIYKPASRARNPERDESPPASPQFLAHSWPAAGRQYAPIIPVGFTRRTHQPPLTPPPSSPANIFRKLNQGLGDYMTPIRTPAIDINEYSNYVAFSEENQPMIATRSTFYKIFKPDRTTNVYRVTSARDSIEEIVPTMYRPIVENKHDNKDKDSEPGYGMMLYNYDDEEESTKKSERDKKKIDLYGNKLKEDKEALYTDIKAENKLDRAIESKTTEAVLGQDDNEEEDVATKRATLTSISVSGVTRTATSAIALPTKTNFKETLSDTRRRFCSLVKLRELNFNSPRNLPEIEAKLKQWAEESPVAKWVDITDGNFTTMERPIYMMIVDDPSSGQVISAKETVMIVAGIQGRDQHAVAAAMHVLYQLIERSESHTDLLAKYRFWIIPVLNPDGYDYAMTFPHRREWTKNLRQNWETCKRPESCQACESFGLSCTIQPCYGVNIDRNFEYQWIPAEELLAEHPCGSLYAGPRQLSEPETNAFTKYLHTQHRPIFTFIAFKEGDILGVMYPYSHTKKKRAFEHIYKQRANSAAKSAFSIIGRTYVAGQTSEFLPLYAGGIEDWVDGHLGVDNTYTIMLFRPTDTYNARHITEQVVHEAYAAMETLVLQSVDQPLGVMPVSIPRLQERSRGDTFTTSATFILIAISMHNYLT